MKEYEIEIHITARKKVKIKAHTEVQAIASAEVDVAEMLMQDEESGRNKYVGAEVQIPAETYELEWEQE
tara:strand:- start:1155 stop:1361 length:207 start_codon:yes stop_codon:yes gene_type:complete